MKEFLKPNTDEKPAMIILGILAVYILICGFIFYLYFIHRISIMTALVSAFIYTLVYIPRFLIIKKLNCKDKIEILEDCMMINGVGIYFYDIKNFKVDEKKTQVIFFINNKMIIFQEAIFHLKLQTEEITFKAIGSEKIHLLKNFLNNITKNTF